MTLHNHIHNAEYLIQRAEQCPRSRKHKVSSPSKWRSIHNRLHDAIVDGSEEDEEGTKSDEPDLKRFRLSVNPLQTLCGSDKNLNRLIVNLFPSDNGYSLMIKNASRQCVETVQLPYDEYEILDYIDNEQIPPLLVQTLHNLDVNLFHSGCIIAEIRDYRISATPTNFETRYVFLRPTQQTLLGDVSAIAAETSHLFRWGNDDKLALESYLVLATAEPLCLDPSPTVQVVKNILDDKKRTFKTRPIKRCLHHNGVNAIRRRRERSKLTAPEPLKLFDFLQKMKAKKKEQISSSTDIRLPKNVVDLWRKSPVDLTFPSNGIEVHNYSKALSNRPPDITDSDLLEVQQIHLKSEGSNRDVYSLITILQRPSDMHYFGKLQSNKYFQQSAESGRDISNSCRFSLGTEHRANLYILQYQELFAEDGRRPATVAVSRPLQQNTTKYQIPLLQQPWQLEQDKSLYSVGSVNNIPVKHWTKLKDNRSQLLPPQHVPLAAMQRGQPSTSQAITVASNPQNSAITTPTLNTITLQPASQSAFVFPVPRQSSQVNGITTQLADFVQGHNQNTVPASRVLGHRLSSDTINLLAGAGIDAGIYQLQENVQPGRRSHQGSQDTFNFGTQPGNQISHNSNANSVPVTPLATPTLAGESTNVINNTAVHSIESNTLNQGGSLSLQLPLTMTIPAQQHQLAASTQGTVQLQTKTLMSTQNQQITMQGQQQQAAGTVIRMPVTVSGANTSGGQQLTAAINLLGGGRSTLSSQGSILGNIQLASGSRLPGGTVTIPANQLPAGIAMQLAAAANQLNQDKGSNSVTGTQQFTLATSGISSSSPITIVTNNNSAGGPATQQKQRQQLRAVVGGRTQQSFVQAGDQQGKQATITFNPQTQMLTANVRGTNVQQPVQLVQVGTNAIQQLPIRIPGQQLLLNTVRSSTGDQSDASPQMTLTQHLQQRSGVATSTGNSSNGAKRSRKRKNTPDQPK